MLRARRTQPILSKKKELIFESFEAVFCSYVDFTLDIKAAQKATSSTLLFFWFCNLRWCPSLTALRKHKKNSSTNDS